MWRHKEMIVEAEGIAANIGAINTENTQQVGVQGTWTFAKVVQQGHRNLRK